MKQIQATNGIVSDVRNLSIEVIITIGGIITSLVTVGLNILLGRFLDFDLLSLSFWFVLPAGALIGGMAVASGYYITARITQTMPSRWLLWNMIAIGVSTWILSKWIPYAMLKLDDGTRVADILPFWNYIKISAENTQLTIGTRSNPNAMTTGELGFLGYLREVLQLIGFIAGGFASFIFLSDLEACESCKRYAKTETLLNAASTDEFDGILSEAQISLPNVVDDACTALGMKELKGLALFLSRCPCCNQEWVRPAVVYQSGRDFTTTKLQKYLVDSEIASILRNSRIVKSPNK